jgi:hypothetical protein
MAQLVWFGSEVFDCLSFFLGLKRLGATHPELYASSNSILHGPTPPPPEQAPRLDLVESQLNRHISEETACCKDSEDQA